jgi:predicted GH43/DUF377 family glycosyl hydrolase
MIHELMQWRDQHAASFQVVIVQDIVVNDVVLLTHTNESIEIATDHSYGEKIPHYFMGAYTFEKTPPFSIRRMSPSPIIGKDFYHGEHYDYYWKPVQVVFPGGYVFDGDKIYLAYGRQDHEIWIATIDKVQLLSSLVKRCDH